MDPHGICIYTLDLEPMVNILDGNSEIGAQVRRNLLFELFKAND